MAGIYMHCDASEAGRQNGYVFNTLQNNLQTNTATIKLVVFKHQMQQVNFINQFFATQI
jgi:hypothetical protein